jgi:hypothetical protein
MIKMTPISWCMAAVALIGALVVTLAAFNREQPLTIADLPPSMPKLPDLAKEGRKNWKEITYERYHTQVIQGQSFDLVIKSTLRNLGNSIVLRSDNYYPKNGGAALVMEERQLLWANLFSLTYLYRNPAPGYHAIFENQGWIREVTKEMYAQISSSDPTQTNWSASIRMLREQETDPSTSKTEKTARTVDCVSQSTAVRKNSVKCLIKDDKGDRLESESVYAPQVGLFFRIASNFQSTANEASTSQSAKKIQVDGVELRLQ